MHDLFEGIVPYEMKLLLMHCVQKKYFSVDDLNERIKCFDFVYDKPSPIDVNICQSVVKICQSASQMMTLSRYFPLLIGDKVPETDARWVSFLLLLNICSIALSPTCTYDTIPYLRGLIEEKLISFKHLYHESRLIPKFHYMVHYPSQIEQFGPLIRSWMMRQESKLSFVKKVSKRGNFKNIPLTVAKKHQLWQCYKFQIEKSFFLNTCEHSPKIIPCTLEAEEEHLITEITRLCPSISTSVIFHPNWVKYQNALFHEGVFLLLEYDFLSPKFGKIVDILLLNGTTIFNLVMYKSEVFVSHYNSFLIESTSSKLALSFDVISYPFPLYSKQSFLASDKNNYITLPFSY